VVLKEKRTIVYARAGEKLKKALALLESHPRCYVAPYRMTPAEVIAHSDLVVSSPFTSPTVEALSARKRAVYYDPTGKFETTFYTNIPGLVCHGFASFKQRVKDLLYHTSEEMYGEYLDNWVKNTLDTHLDGRGLYRFRSLLCGQALQSHKSSLEWQDPADILILGK